VITRVRLEASAATADEVQDDLIDRFADIRDKIGGEWDNDHAHGSCPVLQSTKEGYWGYLVMVRKA
jgi:hypothetical protein